MKTLLAETTFLEQYGLLIALGIVLIGMLVFTFFRNKKFSDNAKTLIDGLKIGDKIKTYTGVYGTVVAFGEETDAKTVVVETGDEARKSYMTIDASVIYSKLNIEEPVAETPVAEVKTEVQEEPKVEEVTKIDGEVVETEKKPRKRTKKAE